MIDAPGLKDLPNRAGTAARILKPCVRHPQVAAFFCQALFQFRDFNLKLSDMGFVHEEGVPWKGEGVKSQPDFFDIFFRQARNHHSIEQFPIFRRVTDGQRPAARRGILYYPFSI
jgi:hypothetical protein